MQPGTQKQHTDKALLALPPICIIRRELDRMIDEKFKNKLVAAKYELESSPDDFKMKAIQI
jgi:hypothetical protein